MVNRETEEFNILWDCDAVLVKDAEVVPRFNKRFETEVVEDDIEHFGWLLDLGMRLSGEDEATVAAWIYDPEVMARAKADTEIKLVSEWLRLQTRLRVNQFVVTARGEEQRELTERQVEREYPWIGRERVFLKPGSYGQVSSAVYKVDKAKELRVAVAVDDYSKTVKAFVDNLDGRVGVMMPDRPWNRKDTDLDMVRVRSAEEIRERLMILKVPSNDELWELLQMSVELPELTGGVIGKIKRLAAGVGETLYLKRDGDELEYLYREEMITQIENVVRENKGLRIKLVLDLDGVVRDQLWENLWKGNLSRLTEEDMEVVRRLEVLQKEFEVEVLIVTNQVRQGHQVAGVLARLSEFKGEEYHYFPRVLEDKFDILGGGRPVGFLMGGYKKWPKAANQTRDWVMGKVASWGWEGWRPRRRVEYKDDVDLVVFAGDNVIDVEFADRVLRKMRGSGSRAVGVKLLVDHSKRTGFGPDPYSIDWLS